MRRKKSTGQIMLRLGFPASPVPAWRKEGSLTSGSFQVPPTFLSDVWPISAMSLLIKEVSSFPGEAVSLPPFSSLRSVLPSRVPASSVCSPGGQWNECSAFWLLLLLLSWHVSPLGAGMSADSSDIYVRSLKWSQSLNFWVGCFPAKQFWPLPST